MGSSDRKELDDALKLMYPWGHIMITDSDREALVRRKLCTTSALFQLVDNYSKCIALTDVSKRAQGMLAEGKQNRCFAAGCAIIGWAVYRLLAKCESTPWLQGVV